MVLQLVCPYFSQNANFGEVPTYFSSSKPGVGSLLTTSTSSRVHTNLPIFFKKNRTKERVAWNVVLYCSNRASICSHALILLSQTRWIVMTGWRTSISLQPVFKHVWIMVPCCLQASVSTLCFKSHVCQTRLNCGSWSAFTHQSPALSNPFGWGFLVCLSASVSSFARLQSCVQTRLDYGCLSVYTHLSTAFCFKHVFFVVFVCLQTSVFSQNGYG